METEESLRYSVNHENGDSSESLRSSVNHENGDSSESLRSSVNHENGDGRILTFQCESCQRRWKHKWMLDGSGRRQKKRIVPFSSIASSASIELTLQTSKCIEPVMTEMQAETEG